ncbi:DUF481 domain-containing protein [Erythrobacter sp. SDW2]|uniref:DUF481 domain-containing protein n=1 Tax=Erythrobacter sp. SDW2 TaxID=2907154 RepID=UPI001F188D08|nr:DUF481 domain-containing protein [Erythrobacter sp. SDW2]UIP05876.1 DUF481 domain-containing protein [Erythrobacter sp. SDW2]
MARFPLGPVLLVSLLVLATPARAELPPGAQAIIDAAIATGDDAKVKTALELARTAFPASAEQIDAISAQWGTALAGRKAAEAAEKEKTIRAAGVFDLWTGRVELGGFQSSGNTDSVGISASAGIKRQGIEWSHALRTRVDFQRQNSTTSRQQVLVAYEPRWQFGEDVFAYGLAQFEHDRLQRIAARYQVSGGIGYRIINEDNAKLSVKAGPAYRVSDYLNGPTESRLGGLFGMEFEWLPLERVKLTQSASAVAETGGQATVFIDAANTSIDLSTGLEFKISDRLVSRFAYDVEYDSHPQAGAVATDTMARTSLIYSF